MATSVTHYGSWVNVGYGEFRLRRTITRTAVSIANNTSTVRSQVWIEARAGGWFTNLPSQHVHYVDGVKVYDGSINRSVANNSSTLVMDAERTLTHNAVGDRSVYTEASFSNYASGNLWVGGSLTLDRIPRATSAVWSEQTTVYPNTTRRLNLPRASSTFTHDVSYTFGSKSGSLGTGLGDHVDWLVPANLLEEFKNTPTGSGVFTTVTKNGSTVIGTTTSSFIVTAGGADAVPTISSVSMTDDNITVKNNIGAFVQGLSRGRVTVTAEAKYGATINNKAIVVGGVSTPENTPILLPNTSPLLVDADVIDSRGLTASKTVSFTTLPYSPPGLVSGTSWSVERVNSSNVPDPLGVRLRASFSAIATTLKVSNVEKNSLAISIRTRAAGTGEAGWTARNNIPNGGLAYSTPMTISGGDIYTVDTSYDVELTIADKTGSKYVLITTVPTGLVALDLNENGVGVGKYHEQGALDVGGSIFGDSFSGEFISLSDAAINTPYGKMGASFSGTTAQRTALGNSSDVFEGLEFWDTTTKRKYSWRNSAWVAERMELKGTAAQRAARVPIYGDLWRDTDGAGGLWKGSNDGRWRLAAAAVTFNTTGWNNNFSNILWARTESYDFPDIWLEPNESLAFTVNGSGNGYEISGMSSRTNRLTNGIPTGINVVWRKTQAGSANTQPSYYTVYIVEI